MKTALSLFYVLDGKEPKPVNTGTEWAIFFENANRVVNYTQVSEEISVSTVFVGLDVRMFSDEKMNLFESMIFGGCHDGIKRVYATWDEAAAGHHEMVERSKLPCE